VDVVFHENNSIHVFQVHQLLQIYMNLMFDMVKIILEQLSHLP